MRLPRVGRARLRLGLLLLAMAAASCSGTGATSRPDATGPDGRPRIPVVAAENVYGDVLAAVGGDRVAVSSLMNDPNADPHAFEASSSAAATVAGARLVIVNGLGYDAFMNRLLDATARADRTVVNVQALRGIADGSNVHLWYDPATMPALARAVADALSQIEPSSAAAFGARRDGYLASLATIHARIAVLHARFAGAPVAFTEDVAGYQTAAIGLDLRTPLGFMQAIEEGIDPPASVVAAQRDLITAHAVRVVVYNRQVTTRVTDEIRRLAEANGIPVVGVAEMIPSNAGTFVDWQLAQLDALGQALGGE